jgi:hypothetical protein
MLEDLPFDLVLKNSTCCANSSLEMGSPFTSPILDAVLLKRFPSKRPLKTKENNAKAIIMIKNNDLSLIFDNTAIFFPIKNLGCESTIYLLIMKAVLY